MKQSGRKWVEKVDKSCIRSTKDKTILLECSVMLNYQLEIVGDEFVTSIGHSDEFYVNLLFDRSIYRLMCTHMGNSITVYGIIFEVFILSWPFDYSNIIHMIVPVIHVDIHSC